MGTPDQLRYVGHSIGVYWARKGATLFGGWQRFRSGSFYKMLNQEEKQYCRQGFVEGFTVENPYNTYYKGSDQASPFHIRPPLTRIK